MTRVLTYGASASDTLRLISGANPPTPVNGQAALPVTVKAVTANGAVPVAGASVLLISSPAASLAICGGSSTCTVLSDLSGEVSTAVTIFSAGINSITAKLAPASSPNPQTVQATIFGTSSVLDISLAAPYLWIAQGATLDVPLLARVLSNGNPQGARTVNHILTKGSGTFSAVSALTDTNGYASSTLHLTAISGDVRVSVCVAPGNAPCQAFYGTAVPLSALQLKPGISQVVTAAQTFQPVSVRVTDSFAAPHPVGATVVFQSAIKCFPENAPVPWEVPTWNAPDPVTQPSMPVILATSQITAQSDFSGVASLQPSTAGIQGETLTLGTASIGNSSFPFQLQTVP